MLKVLNVLGYISLISVIYYILVFLFSFDLTLQIINIVMVIAVILVNILVIKKKKYMGIRILVNLIIIAVLSWIIYFVYIVAVGNNFKNKIENIYDDSGNIMLRADDIKSYSVRYIPDKFYIDNISKGDYKEGYIKYFNSEGYDEPIIFSTTISSFGTHPEHYTIIINNMRYEFR